MAHVCLGAQLVRVIQLPASSAGRLFSRVVCVSVLVLVLALGLSLRDLAGWLAGRLSGPAPKFKLARRRRVRQSLRQKSLEGQARAARAKISGRSSGKQSERERERGEAANGKETGGSITRLSRATPATPDWREEIAITIARLIH